jgi:hypothetical protein
MSPSWDFVPFVVNDFALHVSNWSTADVPSIELFPSVGDRITGGHSAEQNRAGIQSRDRSLL